MQNEDKNRNLGDPKADNAPVRSNMPDNQGPHYCSNVNNESNKIKSDSLAKKNKSFLLYAENFR